MMQFCWFGKIINLDTVIKFHIQIEANESGSFRLCQGQSAKIILYKFFLNALQMGKKCYF